MTELTESLTALVTEKLTVDEFKAKAKTLGCNRVIRRGDITTREFRTDGSRCFIEETDGIVTGVRFG